MAYPEKYVHYCREVSSSDTVSLQMCQMCNDTASTSAVTNFRDWRKTYPRKARSL